MVWDLEGDPAKMLRLANVEVREATATCLLKCTHGCQNKTKDGTIVLLKISSPVEVNKTVSTKRSEDDTHLKIGTCTLVFLDVSVSTSMWSIVGI